MFVQNKYSDYLYSVMRKIATILICLGVTLGMFPAAVLGRDTERRRLPRRQESGLASACHRRAAPEDSL